MPILSGETPARKTRYLSPHERSSEFGRWPPPPAECLETIGCESMSLKSADEFSDDFGTGSDQNWPVPEPIGNERTVKKKIPEAKTIKEFPPALPILNWGNGRPRFDFKKEWKSDGRITMRMVEFERREKMLRCTRGDGRLRIELVGSDGEDEDGCCD